MSAPKSKVPQVTTRFARHAWWILLLVALGLLGLATARRIERVEAITNSPTWSVDPPSRDATSPSGFAGGQRKLVVPGHHNPSFWWIIEAQKSAEQRSLRLRRIDYDAAPEGRDIRRTAPYRWWLIAIGWLHAAVSGEPLGYAIERGALIADPILLALLLVAGAGYAARFIGSFPAIGFVVGGISLFPLAANFQPGAPDPHSLAWVLALGGVLPLLASSAKVGTRTRAHFVIAGVFGGLGLWNDAASQAPLLLAIFLGATGSELIRSAAWSSVFGRCTSSGTAEPRKRGTPNRGAAVVKSSGPENPPRAAAPPPAPWRAWALAGALTTLGASIFEFGPDHFAWSLASVSPIHAVAWWGLGEALRAVGICSREGRKGMAGSMQSPRVAGHVPVPDVGDARVHLALLGIAGCAIALWPVVGMLTGSGALLAPDFSALELANHPNGGVASSLSVWLDRPGGVGAKWATLLPCGLLFVLSGRICLGKLDHEVRGRLVFVSVAALFALVLACHQLRWWNLFDALALAVLVVLFAEAEASGARARWATLGAALLVVPGFFVGFPPAMDGKEVKNLSPLEAQALVARDFSWWLAKRAGPEPNVLFSTPVFSGAAVFYGGFDVVVSSDDTNQIGYLTAVRIASAGTEQEASVLLKSRGISHVALPLWDPILDQLVRIGRSLPAGQELPRDAFSVALRSWEMPLWMRPMDYLIPREANFQTFEVRAFALQAEQEPDLGLSRLADFFVERGQMEEARSVSESLQTYPRSVVALGAIANVDFARRDRDRLKESLETLIPHLSRRAARDLPADRRISLAALFLQTNHIDLAREQVTACFAGLDAATLRTLTPGLVVNLIALSQSLNIPFPDDGLKAAAMELIPPGVRTGLTQK